MVQIIRAGSTKKMVPLFKKEIEKAIKKLLKKKIKIIGSGRTDSGVHAIAQSANFFCEKLDNEKKFLNSLNYFFKQ